MSYDDFDIDDVLAEEESDRDPDSEEIAAIAVNWRTLPHEDASKKWEELRSWVEWISERYAINESVIPDCWWKHGSLVEELSALQTAWNVSYDTTDAGYGPIGFVERWHNAQARLRQISGGSCTQGHRADRLREFPVDDEWRRWTENSHA